MEWPEGILGSSIDVGQILNEFKLNAYLYMGWIECFLTSYIFLGVHDYVCDGSMMGPFNGGYGWSLIDGALLMDPYWWCLGILSR